MTEGLLVVDKPAGWTSHDVVARIRGLAGTRRVGHAGTLDPMATGVLVIGLGRATRLLGHLASGDKEYVGTVRLGVTTATDDALGAVLATSVAEWDPAALGPALAALTGEIEQVPPAYSALKVAGRRAYARARAGEDFTLAPRRVTVRELELVAVRPAEVDLRVVCSAGTYLRSLARDLGRALGVGGHLSALRRTRVGPFRLSAAHPVTELAAPLQPVPVADAVAAAFPRREVDAGQARLLGHGGRLPAVGLGPGPVGVFDPAGELVALVEERAAVARPLVVFAGPR